MNQKHVDHVADWPVIEYFMTEAIFDVDLIHLLIMISAEIIEMHQSGEGELVAKLVDECVSEHEQAHGVTVPQVHRDLLRFCTEYPIFLMTLCVNYLAGLSFEKNRNALVVYPFGLNSEETAIVATFVNMLQCPYDKSFDDFIQWMDKFVPEQGTSSLYLETDEGFLVPLKGHPYYLAGVVSSKTDIAMKVFSLRDKIMSKWPFVLDKRLS